MGTECVKEGKVQTLKSEFEVNHLKEVESVDDFVMTLTSIVSKRCAMGMKEEAYVVNLRLRGAVKVPPDRVNNRTIL